MKVKPLIIVAACLAAVNAFGQQVDVVPTETIVYRNHDDWLLSGASSGHRPVLDGEQLCMADHGVGFTVFANGPGGPVDSNGFGDEVNIALYKKQKQLSGKSAGVYQSAGSCWYHGTFSQSFCTPPGGEWSDGTAVAGAIDKAGTYDVAFLYEHVDGSVTEVELKSISFAPASMTKISEGPTVGHPGDYLELPFEVQVMHCDGNPAGDEIPVLWEVTSEPRQAVGAYVSSTAPSGKGLINNIVTDNQGRSVGYGRLGSEEGTYVFTATSPVAPGVELNFTVNAYNEIPEPPGMEEPADHPDLVDEIGEPGGAEDGKPGECSDFVGDPIAVANGNSVQIAMDYPRTGLSPIEFERVYNSLGSKSKQFRNYWHTTYDRFVDYDAATGEARVRRPDGSAVIFTESGGSFTAGPHVHSQLTNTGFGWAFTTVDKTVESYDVNGNLQTITDLAGRTQTLTYDNNGRLSRVDADTGEWLEFGYTQNDQLATVTDHTSRVWTYEYGNNFNLRFVTDPDGRQRRYHYEDYTNVHALTGLSVKGASAPSHQRQVSWTYDASGRATSSRLDDGTTISENVGISFDTTDTRTVTNSNGTTSIYTLVETPAGKRVAQIEGPGCTGLNDEDLVRQFDPAGNVISESRFGRETQYGNYDSSGQYGYRIEALGTTKERRTDFSYDPRFVGKPTLITRPSVYTGSTMTTEIYYDAAGNITRHSVSGFDPDGTPVSREWNLTYDGPYAQISEINGPRTDVSDITRFEYDLGSGRLNRVIDATGVAIRDNITYTLSGKIDQETRPNGLTIDYDYHLGSDLLASITETGGGATRTTSWEYNEHRQVSQIRFGRGTANHLVVDFSYDQTGRLEWINNHNLIYDDAGNVTLETWGNGPDRGSANRWIERVFDEYDRVDQIIQANQTLDYDFGRDGLLNRSLDGRQQETTYGYDDLRRLTTVVTPGAVQIAFDYDVQDNLVSVTDPEDHETRHVYDDLGNLTELDSPDGGARQYTYDSAGNLTEMVDAAGQHTFYSYDVLNRLTSVDRPGTEVDETYTYDICPSGQGRLCSAQRGQETVAFEYDSLGRVTATTGSQGTVGYEYDGANNIVSLTYPSGRAVDFSRNTDGQITSIWLNEVGGGQLNLIDNVSYRMDGPADSWDYGNGLVHTQAWDKQYWLTGLETLGVLQVDYPLYDGNGNIEAMTVDGANQLFTYDNQDRLDTADGAFGTRDYGYDRVGNRTSLIDDLGLIDYTYALDSNRIATEGSITYQHDPNGNLLERADASAGTGYVWSPDNRLISVHDLAAPTIPIATYTYNALGQRIRKDTAVETKGFVYSLDGLLLAVTDGTGAIQQEIIYLNGRPVVLLPPPDPNTGPVPEVDDIVDDNGPSFGWELKGDRNAVNGGYIIDDLTVQLGAHTWNWVAPVDGNYDIYVNWLRRSNDGNYTRYRVGGERVIVRHEDQTKGAWAYLGNFHLSQGQGLYIDGAENSTRQGGGADDEIFADAARFVLMSADVQQPEYYYIHTDHLRAPRRLTDANGTIVWSAEYDPYGRATVDDDVDSDGESIALDLRFPGQYEDQETGLHYNYFRYYDPELGRYLRSDPIGIFGGSNAYNYAWANPELFVDPYGLYSWSEFSRDAANFSAGWGDTLSFGITARVREAFRISSGNRCSLTYTAGEVAGFMNGLGLGWAQGTKAAAKAASANNWANFSHSLFPCRFLRQFDNAITKWLNKNGNRLNGDFVSPELHTRLDAAAQFGLSRVWLAANPLFSPMRQLINRIPNVPGAALYGAGSAAINQ